LIFNEAIVRASLSASDINNVGSAPGVSWEIVDTADATTFKIIGSGATDSGTVIPNIANDTVSDLANNLNSMSFGVDDMVFFNRPPNASDDVVFTEVDATALISVLVNDVDPDASSSLVLTLTTGGNYGTLAINQGLTITYTPNLGFIGQDTFTYTVADEHGSTSIGVFRSIS